MLVRWVTRACVAQECDLPAGAAYRDRQPAGRPRAPWTRDARSTGVTERSAYYVTVTPQRVDILLRLRARPERRDPIEAFLGFLDAIQWRIP